MRQDGQFQFASKPAKKGTALLLGIVGNPTNHLPGTTSVSGQTTGFAIFQTQGQFIVECGAGFVAGDFDQYLALLIGRWTLNIRQSGGGNKDAISRFSARQEFGGWRSFLFDSLGLVGSSSSSGLVEKKEVQRVSESSW